MPLKAMAIFALFLCAWGLVAASNAVFNSILGEVNQMSPPDQQISPMRVKWKFSLVLQKHRQFFPESRKRFLSNLLVIAGFTCAAAGVFLLVLHHPR